MDEFIWSLIVALCLIDHKFIYMALGGENVVLWVVVRNFDGKGGL